MYWIFIILLSFLSFQSNASIEEVFGSTSQNITLNDILCSEEKEWYIKKGKELIDEILSDKLTQNNMIEHLQQKNLNIYERSKSIYDSALRTVDVGTKLYKGFGNAYSYCFGVNKVTVLDTPMTTTEATELRKKMLQDVILLIWALQSELTSQEDIEARFQKPRPIRLQGEKAEKILNFLNYYMLLASQKKDLNELTPPVSMLKDGTQTVYICDSDTYLEDQGILDQKLTLKTGKLNVYTGCKSSWEDIEYVIKTAPFREPISDVKNTKFIYGIDMIFASNEGTKAILPHSGSAIHFGLLKGETSDLFIQIEPFGLVDADSQIQFIKHKFLSLSQAERFFTFCHQALIKSSETSFFTPNYASMTLMPYQGWQIHIPLNDTNVFLGSPILNYLLGNKVSFKIIPQREMTEKFKVSDVKFGKEIEIYAESEERYTKLTNKLDKLIDNVLDKYTGKISISTNMFENHVGASGYFTSTAAILNPGKSKDFQNKNNGFAFPIINTNGKMVLNVGEFKEGYLFAQNQKGHFLKFSENGKKELGLYKLKNNRENVILLVPFSEYYPCFYGQDPWILTRKNQDNFKPKIEDLQKHNPEKYKEFLAFNDVLQKISPYLEPYILNNKK